MQGHTNLREIRIRACKGAEDRRTGHELSLLSLETLQLNSMPDMRCIWKGLELSRLTTLVVSCCHKLTCVFTGSMVASLVQLQSLDISDCEELEQIIAKDNDDEKDQILSGSDLQSLCFPNLCTVEIKGCNKLRCIWKGLVLSHLTTLEVRDCHKLTHVFTGSMVASLVQLQSLRISDCEELEQIIAKDNDDEKDQILSGSDLQSLCFPNLCTVEIKGCNKLRCIWKGLVLSHLTTLKVYDCHKLTHVFTGSMVASLAQLRKIVISGCEELEQIIAKDNDDEKDQILSGSDLQSLCFPNLCTVEIKGCNKLRCIWKGLVLSHLTTLEVRDCEKLTLVFTVSMVASLVQLQSLYISDCEELEQIIAKDNDDEKGQILSGSDLQSLFFPNLCEVEIKGCNKLRSLFPVAMASGLPKLRKLRVVDSSQLLGVFWQDDEASPVNVEKQMVLPNLTFLSLDKLPSIVCISLGCDDFLFPRLGNPMVDKCPKLTTKLANKTEGHTNLRKIHITNCKGAEDRRTGHELSLLSLETLQLNSMPDMRCIWKGLVLSHLTTLVVRDCHKLTCVFTGSMVASLVQLQSLDISDCEELEQIIAKDNDDEKDQILSGSDLQSLCFPNLCQVEIKGCNKLRCIWKGLVLSRLTTLEVRDCEKLTHVFTGSMVASLVQLQSLRISDCEELEQIIAKDNDDEKDQILSGSDLQSLCFPNLCTVEIKGCNKLRCIWKGLVLSHLTTLEVRDCEKLTLVFTGSMVASLVQLQSLYISDCEELEQIIAKDNDDEKGQILSGSDLQSLFFPNFCEVEIKGCNKLRCIWKGLVLSHLTTLEVRDCEKLKHVFTGSMVASLVQLQSLRISDCEELEQIIAKDNDDEKDQILSGSDLQSLCFPNLCTVEIKGCNKLRCIWKGLVLSHLTTLEVRDCEKLTLVFTVSMVASLVQLQSLYISDCEELEQIIAKDNDDEKGQILSGSDLQSLFFPNLCEVEIKGCNKLRSLFPVAMASGLPKLRKLRVVDSSQLLGVFWQDDEASPVNVEKQMVLPNLTFLSLDKLPSIVCISLGCDDFLFPRLGNPMVDKCPKLTTKLANKTESLPDMRCIWKGLVLSHLTTLKVYDCHKLTHVFTGSMVASLAQLRKIVISGCEELEQIIAKDKDDEREIIQDSLGFPKLKTLCISDCEKLEYVFPVSVSPSLLNLEEMNISFGANLKQIFYRGEGDALTRDGIINFPRLRELSLSRPTNFTAQLPSLHRLSVEGHEQLGNLLAQLQVSPLYFSTD
ncbi:disease resistance protein [Salix suchowensis]|nr:disease resistance protein [Salix suchowensis]